MSLTAIRSDLKTLIQNTLNSGTLGGGKVSDYRKHSTDWQEIYNFYSENNKINAWIIELNSITAEKVASGSLALNKNYNFRIVGIYSLEDSSLSGINFEKALDEILEALYKTQQLNSEARWMDDNPPMLSNITEEMFSNWLVHRAEISVTYTELWSST